jgi:xanthine dehydrogenase accessory factor
MEDIFDAVRHGTAVVARVVDTKGFSTVPVDELVAVDAAGRVHGDLLGRPGAEHLRTAAAALLSDGGPDRLATITIAIHGSDVAELGLSCGGQAEVLMQPAAAIPHQLWDLLAARVPVALVTRVDGVDAGPAALVVDGDGGVWGSLSGADEVISEARSVLAEGRSAHRRLDDFLVEAWVPSPRLVVVGAGEVVAALAAQAGLLGWELRATESPDGLDELFDWAGGHAALIVLSHDPHVDAPALAAGLERGVGYVGAMGSRGTQSRRLERLATMGVTTEQLDRIHRPIGLDLGGRRAPEVALAIVAEILAAHYGRTGRSLRDSEGPIHGSRAAR